MLTKAKLIGPLSDREKIEAIKLAYGDSITLTHIYHGDFQGVSITSEVPPQESANSFAQHQAALQSFLKEKTFDYPVITSKQIPEDMLIVGGASGWGKVDK